MYDNMSDDLCVHFSKCETQAFKPSKELTLKIRGNAVSERIKLK